MKNFILVFLLVGLGAEGFAQAPDTLWTYSRFDSGSFNYWSAGPTSFDDLGNVVAVFYRHESHHANDDQSPFLLFLSPSGQLLEEVQLGGDCQYCYGPDRCKNPVEELAIRANEQLLAIRANNGYCGTSQFVVKYRNSTGAWTYNYAESNDTTGYGCYAAEFMNSDRCVAAGFARSSVLNGTYDALIVMLNLSSGNNVDTIFFDQGGVEVAKEVEVRDSTRFYVAGDFQEIGSPISWPFVLAYDSSGSLLWQRTIETSVSTRVIDLSVRSDGVVILGCTGEFNIALLDSNGSLLGTHHFGLQATSIKWFPDSSFIVAHGSSLSKFRWDFTPIWTHAYGENLAISSFDVSSDWSIAITCGAYQPARVIKTLPDLSGFAPLILAPNGSEVLSIYSNFGLNWASVGNSGYVSIALNRHYPIGAWETITVSTENDGAYEWFVTDPLSDSCRVRICALADTFCDVSDGNFSIVSSQGYLALVKSSQPNTALTNWNAGEVECPLAASQWFRLKNFGSESIVVFQPLEPASAEFSRTTACGAFFALAPNQMSACSLLIVFDPASDGEYSDGLRIQTDAVNGVNGFVEIDLSGEQISTPAAPEVVITTLGLDAHLNWAVVDTSVGGCAVSELWYAVFYSPTSGGPFYYHGWTSGLSYTHLGVVNFSVAQFYLVVGVEGAVARAGSFVEGTEMGIVLDALRPHPLTPSP